jgi:GT2 family glycosyltransferase
MIEPLVAVVVLHWNNYDDTKSCLDSLCSVSYKNMKIIVADNGSTDNSVSILEGGYPQVYFIRNGSNMGFAAGNNLGIEYGLSLDATYILLLNNDTTVDPCFLTELMGYIEPRHDIGMVGPVAYYHHQPEKIQTAGVKINELTMQTWQIVQPQPQPYSVQSFNGVAMLVRVEAIRRAGLLDETYFMYGEELEWCHRFLLAGYGISIVPMARIWHKIDPHVRDTSAFVSCHMQRGKYLYIRRYRAWWSLPPTLLVSVKQLIMPAILAPGSRSARDVMRSGFKGVWSGLRSPIEGIRYPL